MKANSSLINELKSDNEKLRREVDNYQTLISLLKKMNMITSPREEIKGENDFIAAGDEYLRSEIKNMGERDKETLSVIMNSPELKKSCENDSMKDENMKRVWKESLEDK